MFHARPLDCTTVYTGLWFWTTDYHQPICLFSLKEYRIRTTQRKCG